MTEPLRFVVQEHDARSHHFDMRLEKDGVFKSWAVPKGIPIEHGVRRLAMQVEDHDISFGTFEGEIPPGEYGAGTIKIWDHGFYAPTKWTDDLIEFSVDATRETGEYALWRFRKRGGERVAARKRAGFLTEKRLDESAARGRGNCRLNVFSLCDALALPGIRGTRQSPSAEDEQRTTAKNIRWRRTAIVRPSWAFFCERLDTHARFIASDAPAKCSREPRFSF
jgi:DNA ligase D-like protein (predicted 3'-phosphoesterase)